MGEEGRPVDWMLDLAIALIFLALFAAATFNFIGKADFGTGYFKEFYAQDIASITEIVLSAQGDVTVRYDNIKESAFLSFWISDGRVAVGEGSSEEPPDAAKAYFGSSQGFSDTIAIIPRYLVIQQSEGRVSINDILGDLESCPLVDAEKKPVMLSLQGAFSESEKKTLEDIFKESMQEYGIATGEGYPITIEARAGNENAIEAAPSGAEGRAIACYFQEHLSSLTNIAFETSYPQGSSQSVYIKVTTTSDVSVTGRQMANALSLAVARLYG